jgi:hypothetical protein
MGRGRRRLIGRGARRSRWKMGNGGLAVEEGDRTVKIG